MDYIGEIRPSGVEQTAKKIEYLASKYSSNRAFYSVIPSKSYFINDELETPFDYEKMFEILNSNINNATYIDVKDTLSLNDYYVTDPHYRQDKLNLLVNKLGEYLDFNIDITKNALVKVDSFTGQHSAKNKDIKGEEIYYMTNQYIDGAVVTNIMGDSFNKVYNLGKLNSDSQYDLFLSGPSPICIIKNGMSDTDKRLIIFNDSYSLSLAPLLIENYSEIALVDLRYVASPLIENYVTIGNADLLFLYNEQVVNNGEMIKVIFN